jgi:hypothetical protein
VISPESDICPTGWAGIVAIADMALATAPTEQGARALRGALTEAAVTTSADIANILGVLQTREVLGPAALAYLDPARFTPPPRQVDVEQLSPGDPDLDTLRSAVLPAEREESGLDEITSPVSVVRDLRGDVVAAAGYQDWPRRYASLCVLAAARVRGQGLATAVASEAIAGALAVGRRPQWRARPWASRRLARTLCFEEIGAQLSLRLDMPTPRPGRGGA